MSEHLKSSQRDLTQKIANVQRVGSWVKADIGSQLCAFRTVGKFASIGGVVDEASTGEFGDDVTKFRHRYRVERLIWH